MSISYNLIDEPWIPCIDMNNEFHQLSIRKIFQNAPQIKEITSQNPLVVISLYRFLLAILHRNFGPEYPEKWIELFEKGEWDMEILNEYFKKWHPKFDLFSESADERFYQINPPEVDDSKAKSITILNHGLASGNNATLFDHTFDKDLKAFDAGEAALLLIAYQNYALGGGVSSPFYYSHAPLVSGVIAILKGESLFHTLMLNLIPYNDHSPFPQVEDKIDLPFWERKDKSLCEDKNGRLPNGYLDYLTWQSRRIWLIPEEQDGKIIVRKCIIAQGEKVAQDFSADPFMAYMAGKKGELSSLQLSPYKQIWRQSETLLRLQPLEKLSNKPPLVLSNISQYLTNPREFFKSRYNLELYGLMTEPGKAAKVLTWHYSNIPLPLQYLKSDFNKALINGVNKFIKKIEKIHKILNSTIWNFGKKYLFPKHDNLSTNQRNQVDAYKENFQISSRFFNTIEPQFYQFLQDLVEFPDFKKSTERNAFILSKVNMFIKPIANQILSDVERNLKNDPRALKAFISIKGIYYSKLTKLLKD